MNEDEIQNWTQLVEATKQQEKEVERLTLEVETLKAFERNRSQAYHSKPVVPEVDTKLAGAFWAAGIEWYLYNNKQREIDALETAIAAWKARQEGVVDLGDV